MDYAFEQLLMGDVDRLKQLLRVFGQAFNEIDTYQQAIPSDEYLSGLLSKPYFIALAALDDGQRVVGGIAAYELEKFERERREIYIYDLAVLETHRRRRVATRLIRALRLIAQRRGAYVIFVQADHGDTPAIRLYESLGRKEDVYHFDISVP